ncbi:MAG: lytic transglycosylase domain-containing protein [Armatimonadota bacterium]
MALLVHDGISLAAPSRGAQYVAKCRELGLTPSPEGPPAGTVSTNKSAAWEVAGTLCGYATRTMERTYTLLIQMDNGQSVSITGSGQCPDISVGTRIRALVVERTPQSQEPLLAAVATESEIRAQLASAAVRETKRQPARATLSSRSMYITQRPAWSPNAVIEAYKRAIAWFNPRLSDSQLTTIAQSVLGFSTRYGVDGRLIMAVLAVESGFKIEATSRKGAMGLGQLMPATARGLGVTDPYDPIQNIAASVRLIRGHLEKYAGKGGLEQLALALASYNAGSGAVKRYGGVPPYRETRNYIRKVAAWYRHFCTGQ